MPVTFNNFTTGTSLDTKDLLLGVSSDGTEFVITPSNVVRDISSKLQTHPATPAAWVNFEGTQAKVGGKALIYSSYNVDSVERLTDFGGSTFYEGYGGHRYRIVFKKPMVDDNYAVATTGLIGLNDPFGDDQHVGVYSKYTNTKNDCIVTTVDMDVRGKLPGEGSRLVNVVIFGNKTEIPPLILF